jgi:hypothetical protein
MGLPAEEEKPARASGKRKQADEGQGQGEAPAAKKPKMPRVVKGQVKPFEAAAVELKRLVWIPWGKVAGRRTYWPGVILVKEDMRDKLIKWPSEEGVSNHPVVL